MNITIDESIVEKIKRVRDGIAILNMLETIANRQNTEYNRGVVHGYLLTLTTTGVIDGKDAFSILEQIER